MVTSGTLPVIFATKASATHANFTLTELYTLAGDFSVRSVAIELEVLLIYVDM